MVECTGLENRRGGDSTVGSNPTSSARTAPLPAAGAACAAGKLEIRQVFRPFDKLRAATANHQLPAAHWRQIQPCRRRLQLP